MKDDCIIKLKNVSKFYYSKGVIASGFSKLNLEFRMGEFVAITGESGSGKSTLLNVISGLDSYEEGEMYIDGKETSHYTEKDFEDYRRKYIGNIFQNFNLVNSYTVYQNIELVLLLNGNSKYKIKENVIELIKKVGLYKFRNTKVSKLSGGQKQRVAIARALAKDTPMIIADEPTGNLDSKSAKEIIKLLSEIAKDKLVIIVTHNYEQVEEYVSRKIKMHDGKVLEDKILKKTNSNFDKNAVSYKNITLLNRLCLGVRNTFNVVPKFLLVMAVYLFLSVAIISVYATMQEEKISSGYTGYNYSFYNSDADRIVIKKMDGTSFSEEDYEKISKINNVDKIMENDLLVDSTVYITNNENLWVNGYVDTFESFSGEVDFGRLPENDNEIIVYSDDYYFNERAEEYINKKVTLYNDYSGQAIGDYTVVGIKRYIEPDVGIFTVYRNNNTIYVGKTVIDKLSYSINQYYSTTYVTFLGKKHKMDTWVQQYKIEPSDKVARGEALIHEDFNYMCPNNNCHWQSVDIQVDNKNFKTSRTSHVVFNYTKKNYSYYFGSSRPFEEVEGIILINNEDYKELYDKGIFQSSVYVKDVDLVSETGKQLRKEGYDALVIKETFVDDEFTKIYTLIQTAVMVGLVISVFFICYFVLNIILKSRNTYFATIRMLGANSKIANQLLSIELVTASSLAYALVMLTVRLLKNTNTTIDFIYSVNKYLVFRDYVLLFVIIFMMSYLISKKYARKLFKKSAMSTIREGGL